MTKSSHRPVRSPPTSVLFIVCAIALVGLGIVGQTRAIGGTTEAVIRLAVLGALLGFLIQQSLTGKVLAATRNVVLVFSVTLLLHLLLGLTHSVEAFADLPVVGREGRGHFVTHITEAVCVACSFWLMHSLLSTSRQLGALNRQLEEAVSERTALLAASLERERKRNTELQAEVEKRQQAEAAFQAAQRAEVAAEISGGLAHNFNNLMSVLTMWSELISQNPTNSELVAQGMADVSEATRQAVQLTYEITSLSRNHIRERRSLDPLEHVGTQLQLARTLLPADVRLESDLTEVSPIHVDPSELQQMLLNLVLNARDAIHGPGHIHVRLYDDQDEVVLEVEDSGEGFDDDTKRRIFEPFFTTKGRQGTGLGLASLKQSMDELGGSICVTSQLGVGTCFALRFKRSDALSEDLRHETRGDERHAAGAKLLVVDDDLAVLRAVQTSLRAAGHEVMEASDLQKARRAWKSGQKFDLLITDAVMPDGSVFDFVDEFHRECPNTPVLVCSGHVDEAVLALRLKAGDYDFLQKPFNATTLRDRVAHSLSTRSRRPA